MQGHSIEVVKTLKANGENAQISWNPDIEAWLVASKNAGVILRNREDMKEYIKDVTRY